MVSCWQLLSIRLGNAFSIRANYEYKYNINLIYPQHFAEYS